MSSRVHHPHSKAISRYNYSLNTSFQLLWIYYNPVINVNHQKSKRKEKELSSTTCPVFFLLHVSSPFRCFSSPLIVIHLSSPCLGRGSFCNTAPGALSVCSHDYFCWLVLSIPLILSANLVGSPWGYFSFNLNTFFNFLILSNSCYHSICSVRYSASLFFFSPKIYWVQKRNHKIRLKGSFQRLLYLFFLWKDCKKAASEQWTLIIFSEISSEKRIHSHLSYPF